MNECTFYLNGWCSLRLGAGECTAERAEQCSVLKLQQQIAAEEQKAERREEQALHVYYSW